MPHDNTLCLLINVFARLQDEFEETVASNMEEFGMEVSYIRNLNTVHLQNFRHRPGSGMKI